MGVNNSLLKSMQTIVDKAIEVAPFDKTRQAQVITNNADGTYTIRLDGILYNNVPSYPQTSSISAGSVVKIITPSNQPSQMFIQSLKGGGGGDHVELTQSQYNALTPSQKTDGTVYFVTDGDSECFIMSDSVPIGAIQAFGGRVAPEGWLICDGSAISRETYLDLFKVIGIIYGSGDGSTTFNLPDLRGNVAIGVSNDYVLGDAGGEETHTLTINEMPSHTHTTHIALGWQTGGGNAVGKVTTNNGNYDGWSSWADSTGGDQPHNNMQPYIVTNYIIKAFQPPTDNVIKSLDPDHLLLDAFYPVGTEYSTTNSAFDPNITWDGTWTKTTILDDEIVEQGTDGIWTYKKWASGLCKCWGRQTFTSTTATAWGSCYWLGPYMTLLFPTNMFIDNPSINLTRSRGVEGWVGYSTSDKNGISGLYLIRPATATGNYEVSCCAEGLWKTYEAPRTIYKWTRTA